MTHYRMIVADLDGTLRVEHNPPSTRVRRAIAQAQQLGVRVVLATGRTFLTTRPLLQELGLRDAVICDQGATIREVEGGVLLQQLTIPPDLAQRAIDYARKNHFSFLVAIRDEFYTAEVTQDVLGFVGHYQDHLYQIDDWAPRLAQGAQKISFVNDPVTTTHILAELRGLYDDQLQVVQSYPLYVELTHPAASKGRAAAWLAERWGIRADQVVAIGDHDNDRSMIEWAGLGVAMGNAADVLKNVAGHIAGRVEMDGAAQVIEEFVVAPLLAAS